MGVREYARRKGVSHSAIRKAIATGRIENAVFRDTHGRPRIDPELADELFEQETDISAQRLSGSRAGGPGAPKKGEQAGQEALFDAPSSRTAPTSGSGQKNGQGLSASSSFVTARAVRETYEAQLSRLSLEEKTGRLVDAAEVRIFAARVARTVREHLLNLPYKIGPLVAVESDEHACIELLAENINQALETLADEFKKL